MNHHDRESTLRGYFVRRHSAFFTGNLGDSEILLYPFYPTGLKKYTHFTPFQYLFSSTVTSTDNGQKPFRTCSHVIWLPVACF
jgi:hypothetical protein